MGWWFGRKSAPEPVRAFVPAWLGAGGSEGFARGYEAQFDEVYRNNPVGQRAVRLVAGMLGSLTISRRSHSRRWPTSRQLRFGRFFGRREAADSERGC